MPRAGPASRARDPGRLASSRPGVRRHPGRLVVLRGDRRENYGPLTLVPPAADRFYQAGRVDSGATELARLDPVTGAGSVRVSLAGPWTPRVVSTDGRLVALTPDQPGPVTRTPLVIASAEGERHRFDLKGNIEPDAFASDGSALFVLQWLPDAGPFAPSTRGVRCGPMTVADALRRAARSLVAPRQLRRVARDRFGYTALRPGQLGAMRAVLSGRDALVVLPTGAGKSAVYQVPAALLPGPTVVVSPLLALQQDQMVSLAERGDPALAPVRISSAESPAERRDALATLKAGRARFLFVTPEQLADPDRLAEIAAVRPALVAVDEAHCISAWGHDFRPDYLQLGRVIRELGRPPVVALTATASPPVREDIVERLGLTEPFLVVMGLDRPNVFLEAVHCVDEEQRWQRLVGRLRASPAPGIVYAATRRATEDLARRLARAGFSAQAYHGGMSAAQRERRHDAFLADEIAVMVATTAFGMGIDKPNIRWVNHVTLPDSPDSYLQEVGRAGRDWQPAQALLLHRTEDAALRRFFSTSGADRDELVRVATLLRAARAAVSRDDLRSATGYGPRKLGQLLSLLEQVGAVAGGAGGKLRVPRYAPDPAAAADLAIAHAERFQTVQRSRIDMMRHLAETTSCRGQALVAYFGEHLAKPCGHCDNCADGSAAVVAAAPTTTEPYPVHSAVRHAEWGDGIVLQYHGERMTVLFDDVGYKTLSVPVVVAHRLLTAPA